jgi:hypothetical protein
MGGLPLDGRFGEVSGGRDIWPDADGNETLARAWGHFRARWPKPPDPARAR